MKLKYYLGGLGIGIIVIAIVMGIALSGKKETLSDEEIIERAEVLGMVMEGELGPDREDPEQENNSEDPGTTQESQPNGEGEGDGGQDRGEDNEGDSGQDRGEDNGDDSSQEPDEELDSESQDSEIVQQPSGEDGGVVELEIKEGEFSDVISKKLYQAGLIPDAEKFNTYMTQKGVDDSLRIGVHLIPMGASADEIIDILKARPQ